MYILKFQVENKDKLGSIASAWNLNIQLIHPLKINYTKEGYKQ